MHPPFAHGPSFGSGPPLPPLPLVGVAGLPGEGGVNDALAALGLTGAGLGGGLGGALGGLRGGLGTSGDEAQLFRALAQLGAGPFSGPLGGGAGPVRRGAGPIPGARTATSSQALPLWLTARSFAVVVGSRRLGLGLGIDGIIRRGSGLASPGVAWRGSPRGWELPRARLFPLAQALLPPGPRGRLAGADLAAVAALLDSHAGLAGLPPGFGNLPVRRAARLCLWAGRAGSPACRRQPFLSRSMARREARARGILFCVYRHIYSIHIHICTILF